jgi:hypothetical protein
MVLVVALAGCSGQQEAGWTEASAALQAHGVFSYQVRNQDPGVQVVALRDAAQQSIGELAVTAASEAQSVDLSFQATHVRQEMATGRGEMKLTLDAQTATLAFDGQRWLGDDAAQSLFAAAQPYLELVQLLGFEAQLGTAAAPPGSAYGSPAPSPSSPASPGTPTPKPPGSGSGGTPTGSIPLCCSSVVTTSSGWAWYWEPEARAMSCRRAREALELSCGSYSFGLACCNTPPNDVCNDCVNWGTGWSCGVAGYLQSAC